MCPPQAILEPRGRCLLCCRLEDKEAADNAVQQDCCNCTETRGMKKTAIANSFIIIINYYSFRLLYHLFL